VVLCDESKHDKFRLLLSGLRQKTSLKYPQTYIPKGVLHRFDWLVVIFGLQAFLGLQCISLTPEGFEAYFFLKRV
jgi:hypothetical protein